ncbi:AMP-binding protein [Oharaeibacter diazotrophicus]|uniref:Acyl-CoA synthetase (AMP-forming)/AMP-acid ligase II n=2 Tax=Oharaeibacter diazotrophicus TaxID=1920512 RepID=A0A4R6RLE4_9HYPH|nr:AMP-binding protein [Oharaeibacter diazotrophicus]TDP87344.1 acyl-CoA synthetase (AMP-forming)/AMP-acid ligase II [Oharaeibacter diazotrophicus]BBE70712.1 long-chain-fatty-acid-CoA ligase [Pleomorphomonas sp. SM30]GLS77460.1 AMP-dependent synthetase [Oharaeibacter diazotrophicus]
MEDWFWRELGAHGARPALIVPGRDPVRYDELADRARDFAARLGPGRRLVAVEAAPSDHAVTAWLGALVGGHAVALVAPDDAAARHAFADRFAPDATVRRVAGRWRLEESAPPSDGDRRLHPDLAEMLVTSGSTGCGKAVRLSRRAVDTNARAIARYLGLSPADRAALVLPLHYSYGLSVLASHLAVGASVDLGFGSVLDDGFVDRLAASGCTGLAGVPYTYDLLERIGFRDRMPAGLRTMTVAGGRPSPDLVVAYDAAMRRTGGRFFAMYGQTEATARIAYLPPERAADAPDRIGVAIPGGSLALVGDDGRPVTAPGAVGELVYRGPNVMMGYAETAADLARGHEVETLATGDLAEVDADGLYRIVGRRARFSKIAGVRVGHDAVEAALRREGVVAAVTGDDRGLAAAFVGARAVEDVRRRLAAVAGLTLRHVRAVRVDDLPRLASGKVDLAAVGRLCAAPAPRDAGLAAAFREVFYPHPVADGDSFAALAGDSLRYVEISALLEQRLGRIPEGWETMTLADLTRLGREDGGPGRSIRIDLLIRALAILLVVTQHATLWPIPGGSAAMTVLIGFGLARFQRDSLAAGDLGRVLRPLASVLAPYYALVAAYALVWDQVPWASVFLVGNFGIADPVRHTMLPFLYWYVEVYAQTMLLLAAVFSVPAVRRAAGRDPFRLGLVFLAVGVAAHFAGPALWPIGDRKIFTLPWVLPLAAFGWCAAVADTPARRAVVLAVAAVAMPLFAWTGGNWTGAWVLYGLQIAVIAALLHLRTIRLPAPLAAGVLALATASFHVYLFHRFVPELFLAHLEPHLGAGAFAAVSVVGGVLFGWSVHRLVRELRARMAARHGAGAMAPPARS